MDVKSARPVSLRDAFTRIVRETPLANYRLILAEDVEAFFPRGEYQELLKFESDIAQISELLMLFSESAGSLAELGVFVMDEEVAPRLLVIVDDHNYAQDSFIRLGPLYSLMLRYGDASVCVLPLSDLNLKTINDVSEIDLRKFRTALETPLRIRLNSKREPRTFDRARHGHVTKLITGLIQYYAALTLDEIDVLLYSLGIPLPAQEIRRHLLCAHVFEWIYIEKRGIHTYYAAIATNAAVHFDFAFGLAKLDRRRIRSDIIDYWRQHEPERFGIITIAATRSAA